MNVISVWAGKRRLHALGLVLHIAAVMGYGSDGQDKRVGQGGATDEDKTCRDKRTGKEAHGREG